MNSPLAPFRIFIGGQELLGWTEASLTRSKKEMTGTLSCAVFFTYLPRTPVMRNAVAGAEVTVYVGGHLAFWGKLDDRNGRGRGGGGKGGGGAKTAGVGKSKSIGSGKHTRGGAVSTSITAENYVITLRARGKTKPLIDSSHDHKTGTILNAKTRPVIEKLIESHQIDLEWIAPVHDMDKIRFRDGVTIDDEVFRVANEYGYAAYETRDGRLRVTDGTGGTSGEPLILGDNILEFSAEQNEEPKNTEIKIKGQRTKKNVRGRDAVNREKTIQLDQGEGGVSSYRPINMPHDTDASDEGLERRARHEADKRTQESKQVRVDVFHVQSRDGSPWDIGQTHYVEVPTEGIFEEMECTELTYVVSHDKRLKTQLTLSPLPAGGNGMGGLSQLVSLVTQGAGIAALGGSVDSILNGKAPGLDRIGGAGAVKAILSGAGGIFATLTGENIGAMRRAQLGIPYLKDQYPESWGRPVVRVVEPNPNRNAAFASAVDAINAVAEIAKLPAARPPLKRTD